MPNKTGLLEALSPLMRTIASNDLSDPGAAAELEARHPADSLGEVERLLIAARDEGWLCPRQATPTLSFGRVSKPSEETFDLSVDAVDMAGPGPGHVHPRGEVSLCFATEGTPRFCGEPPGWVVVPPGSHHVPTVTDGRMVIVYFLPGGAVEWT